MILFCIIYGVTGATSLAATLYILLRRGNAFAADIHPPLRLRRWAAALFGAMTLMHVWWYLFFILSGQPTNSEEAMRSPWYAVVNVLDWVALLSTFAGTLLAMLQDRRRSVWPAVAALLPFVVIGVAFIVWHSSWLIQAAFAYILLILAAFTVKMGVAVRQYGRWLRDNYADLERKEVRLSYVVGMTSMFLLVAYTLIESNIVLLILLHLVELLLTVLLLWRVETLPLLDDGDFANLAEKHPASDAAGEDAASSDAAGNETSGGNLIGGKSLSEVGQLLEKHCVVPQLYLQHDLTLQQLAKAIGTNRTYLGQYFSTRGTTYNMYINNLRINHFIALCTEAVAARRPFTAQQLSMESGYRSYSTFANAFKQLMGKSVSSWVSETAGKATQTE